ncbi:Tol-Pal system beta propeller repeat protein TolB [hydrothermal vent metagenome]|uniref:Tol-Pal system beta propeller repeat protein TolB n=1 Tax=hydrothermal vent metagenome TaxID=652676 RepID=A0A3B0Z4V2_9ZZZZ
MKICTVLLSLLLFMPQISSAVLKIDITQQAEGALPIAIVPFAWETPRVAITERLDEVIKADLHRSGYFQPIAKKDFLALPTKSAHIQCKDWRVIGAENVVVGSVRAIGAIFEVHYELFDAIRCMPVESQKFRVTAKQLRRLAHQISDKIYQALTGQQGAFTTRIAYVVAKQFGKKNRFFSLQVADSDGYDPKTIFSSKESIISVSWSPDGRFLAYASFEHGPSTVYVQEVGTGKRERLLKTKDAISSPAWSPDGSKLAVVISRKGKRDVYVVDYKSRLTQRLTRTSSANFNTEPVWSPDGKHIVYTAHSGGRPQLYRIDVGGGRAKRLTFEGKYNTRGAFSPDGKLLAMVHSNGAGYHIAVLELTTGAFSVLTNTKLDESPTFAPNGSMILFATRDRNRGVLAAVSADGRVSQRFELNGGGDAREPAWGPFLLP